MRWPVHVLIVVMYWLNVVYFLLRTCPVFIDIGGPTSGFYWGFAPVPDLGEYNRHRLYYDAMFFAPHFACGAIMTALGYFVAPLLVWRMRALSARPFTSSVVTTTLLVLLGMAVSDLGVWWKWWEGYVFLLSPHKSASYFVFELPKFLLPVSLLSGATTVLRAAQVSRK